MIANVAPSVADCAMTLNTLRYVTPLKIGQTNREKKVRCIFFLINFGNLVNDRNAISSLGCSVTSVVEFCKRESTGA